MWERFPKYAPRPVEVQDIEKSFGDLRFPDIKVSDICHWFRREPTSVDLLSVLDVESEFYFRPYMMLPAKFGANNDFLAGGLKDFTQTQLLSPSVGGEPDQFTVEIWYGLLIATMPFFLPSFEEEREVISIADYNPHRYIRQFGFDQFVLSVPIRPIDKTTTRSCIRRPIDLWL